MSKPLDNKIAFVTAAGQGIGRATAELFRDQGAHVIATDINEATLSTLTGCENIVLDVTDAQAVKHVFGELKRLDILFNCVGFVPNGSIMDCDEEEWALTLELNVTSMYRLIRLALPLMLENGGSIINMSSVASSVLGVPNRFAYGTSKAAVIGLTKSVAADFVGQKIRCNAICPGTVQSPSLDQRLIDTGDYDKALQSFVNRQPMGRLGRPAEIAALAAYLASDVSEFTTGQCHIIDGGWSNV